MHLPNDIPASPQPMTARSLATLLVVGLLGAGCAALAPLSAPPRVVGDDPVGDAATREDIVERLGPPLEVRASDVGQVLVYQRLRLVSGNPNRYYGQDQGARLARYDRLLVYLDPEGRVVRWTVEPE